MCETSILGGRLPSQTNYQLYGEHMTSIKITVELNKLQLANETWWVAVSQEMIDSVMKQNVPPLTMEGFLCNLLVHYSARQVLSLPMYLGSRVPADDIKRDFPTCRIDRVSTF